VKRQKQRPSYSKPEARVSPLENSRPASEIPKWLGGLFLVIIVFLAYLRACRGEFIWDDDANVTNNLTLRGLAGLRQIWLQPGATQQYYPLTHTAFWLDYHLWGLHPLGYHLANILLHAANALLLWMILRRLQVPGAWLGAALFALHPVNVESVAWITERKNTLAGVFFLSSLLVSLKFWLPNLTATSAINTGNSVNPADINYGPCKYWWLTFVLYLCALWSKTATIGLPAVILLLVWWRRQKVSWRDFLLLVPFVVIGTALGLITAWVEKHNLGATGKDWNFSAMERCCLAGRIVWFYLGKLAWPHPLMFLYPRWTLQTSGLLAWLPVFATIGGILILWRFGKPWARATLFTLGYFLVMLFPVLGFFNVYFFRFSFVCDHFQYLASMGPLALAGAGICVGLNYFPKKIFLLVRALLLLALGWLTWQQTGIYHDRETLWRDSLAHNPDAWMAHNNLGSVLLQNGRTDEAITHFQRALQIRPEDAAAHNNLGAIFLKADKVADAIAEFQAALQIEPKYAAARANLGGALLQTGHVDEAIKDYEMALQIQPDDLAAHVNLGDALFHQERVDEAVAHYRKAIEIARTSGRQNLAEQLSAELRRQQASHPSPH
jgi:Tfp pilus assembly protein PilF